MKLEKLITELNKNENDSRLNFNFKVKDKSFKILDTDGDNWTIVQYNGSLYYVHNKATNLVQRPFRCPEGIAFTGVDDIDLCKKIYNLTFKKVRQNNIYKVSLLNNQRYNFDNGEFTSLRKAKAWACGRGTQKFTVVITKNDEDFLEYKTT